MKTILVTQANLHLIKFRIEQFLKRHKYVKKVFLYPVSEKRNKLLYGIPSCHMETIQSHPCFIFNNDYAIKIGEQSGEKYISINYDGSQKGSLVENGQRFKFTPTHIFQFEPHPVNRKENCKVIWSPATIEDIEKKTGIVNGEKPKEENTEAYKEAVTKAVKWWSEKSFNTKFNQNNGDNTKQGDMTHMLMNMVASKAQEQLTEGKIRAFENKLTQLLMKAQPHERTLDVDYHPCRLLAESAQFAGIDSHCFPCKSHTRITNDNRVYAKYQYGASTVEI